MIDLLREEISALEASLLHTPKHECRFCLWFDCGDKCKCGCGSVSKTKALHLERLRFLVSCAETGEVPIDERGTQSDGDTGGSPAADKGSGEMQ